MRGRRRQPAVDFLFAVVDGECRPMSARVKLIDSTLVIVLEIGDVLKVMAPN
jgi:hypothetical protein